MAGERDDAIREVRSLLAACRAQLGTDDGSTLTLLVRAIERLADAIEGRATTGGPRNESVVDETTGASGAAFDRGRPPRGYKNGE